jgi:hypothetical protein
MQDNDSDSERSLDENEQKTKQKINENAIFFLCFKKIFMSMSDELFSFLEENKISSQKIYFSSTLKMKLNMTNRIEKQHISNLFLSFYCLTQNINCEDLFNFPRIVI